MTSRVLPVMILLAGLLARPAPPEPNERQPEIVVYAAASLRDALESLEAPCERATRTNLVLNLGASSDLERQIEAGNKADVYFSADEAWMDRLDRAGLMDGGSRRSVLSNRLVVVGRAGGDVEVHAPADLLGARIRRVALADPAAVPAGKYAKAWLQKSGQWDALEERLLPSIDVRAALAAVEAGGAEVGIVYRTDARVSKKVRVLYEVPEEEGPAISYAIAAMRDRPNVEAARRVVAFLAGPDAAATFESLGFIVKPGGS